MLWKHMMFSKHANLNDQIEGLILSFTPKTKFNVSDMKTLVNTNILSLLSQ